jgi:hypothetical protein
MTVPNIRSYTDAVTCDGVKTVFDFTFKVFKADHLVLEITETATGAVTKYTSGFSVVGLGVDDGGTLTYPTSGSPIATGHTAVVRRVVPYTQEYDLSSQGRFNSEQYEEALDLLAMQLRQLADLSENFENTIEAINAAQVASAASAAAAAASETAAADSATNSATSATNSANSATSATNSASQAAAVVAALAANTQSVNGAITIDASTDKADLFRFHTSAGTANLGAAATMGDEFTCFIKADGVDVTIDPNSSETINGLTTLELADGQSCKLYCDGTTWQAVLIGAGSGGIVYTEKTSAYTAEAGDGIGANTSGGAFTITLPASPEIGDIIVIADTHHSWATNNLTVARNGNNIQFLAEDLVCDTDGVSIRFKYFSNGWVIYPTAVVTGSTALLAENNLSELTDKAEARSNLNQWVDKTAAYTLVVGDWVYADTSGGAFTLTLPASPSNGDEVRVADPNTAWATNSVTIARNGNNISGNSDDMECSTGAVTHIFTYDSSAGNWRVQTLSVAGGDYGNAPRQLLQTINIGSDASIDITGINSDYDKYEIDLIGVVISTDGQSIRMRTSSDGGSSFDSGASDYRQVGHTSRHSGSTGSASELYYSVVDDEVQLNYGAGVGNAGAERFNCTVEIFTPSETAPYCTGHFRSVYQYSADGTLCRATYAWERRTGNVVDAVQFFTPVGTFTSGTIKVYGVR